MAATASWRHGHGPHRAIQTGVGPVEVRRAKVRDRGDVGAEEKIRFDRAPPPHFKLTRYLRPTPFDDVD
jgi:hypothetical protein